MSGYVLPFNNMAPKLSIDTFVAENAVVIGDVEIGEQSSIWYGTIMRGDVNRIHIGSQTNIQDGAVVHVNHDPLGDYRETGGGMPTWIGDRVTIGHMALIHACTIETGGFVGMRATVMDGAVVEEGAMVAAGALVTANKRVPAGELWGGSPAKKMRDLTPQEKANLEYQARHYAHLADAYLNEGL